MNYVESDRYTLPMYYTIKRESINELLREKDWLYIKNNKCLIKNLKNKLLSHFMIKKHMNQ